MTAYLSFVIGVSHIFYLKGKIYFPFSILCEFYLKYGNEIQVHIFRQTKGLSASSTTQIVWLEMPY